MSDSKTLADLLDEVMQITKTTLTNSTYRGRQRCAEVLRKALKKIKVEKIKDFEESRIKTAELVEEIQKDFNSRNPPLAKSTVDQMYHQIIKMMQEMGADSLTLAILKNSKRSFKKKSKAKRYKQENITKEEMEKVLEILDNIAENKDFKVKGSRTTKRKKLMLRLYIMIAASYALRQGTIMRITAEDITQTDLTYELAKGERDGESHSRKTTEAVWEAYQDYIKEAGITTGTLFNCDSWLSSAVAQVMQQAGVQSDNGRYGIHRFRRAFGTYCLENNIPVEHAAAGLNHSDSSVTERVYQDLSRKDIIGKETIARYSSHFLAKQEDMSQDCFDGLDDWVRDIFEYGQPIFNDETVHLYLDDDADADDGGLPLMVPTPGLEPGTP